MTAALATGFAATQELAEVAPAPQLRVVLRPAPETEPPFDDECPGGPAVTRYDRRLPFVTPPAPVTRLTHPPRRGSLPDPAIWGRRLLIGLTESADGRRPLHQLAAMLSSSVTRGIGADFERTALAGTPHWLHRASVRTVRSSEPADGVAELSATVETGNRVRAIALRLEERHGRWCCVRLQLG